MSLNLNSESTVTGSDGKTYKVTQTVTEVVTATAPSEPVVTEPPPATEPAPIAVSGTPPLIYEDARFNANVSAPSTTVQRGSSIQGKSITDTGHTASIILLGNNSVNRCRIRSREGIRVASGGEFVITDTYVEVNGTGRDHADGLQTYAPGSRGKIIARNSTFKCGLDASTAGFFIADNWTGGSELENVVFLGGPFGLRAHSDTGGDLHVSLKNVSFVGPFKYKPFLLSGENGTKLIIDRWENVCMATISNGQLVKGAQIPRPF